MLKHIPELRQSEILKDRALYRSIVNDKKYCTCSEYAVVDDMRSLPYPQGTCCPMTLTVCTVPTLPKDLSECEQYWPLAFNPLSNA